MEKPEETGTDYTSPPPETVEAILYSIESPGLSRRDLEQLSRARVSQILNQKHPLTVNEIRKRYAGLRYPAEGLAQPCSREESATSE
ncbi:MAG: hypothetical protein AB9866_19885 [Syntrophobacteraceae bacterium]